MSQAVCPNLVKFYRHFDTSYFGHFESVHFVFGKILSSFWQICYAIGKIFIGAKFPNIKQKI